MNGDVIYIIFIKTSNGMKKREIYSTAGSNFYCIINIFLQSYKIDHICNIGNVLMSEKTMFLCCLSLS